MGDQQQPAQQQMQPPPGIGITAEQVNYMIQQRLFATITTLAQQGLLPHQDKPKPTIEVFSKRLEAYNIKVPFHDWKKKMLCTAFTVSDKHRDIMNEAEKISIEINADQILTWRAEHQWDNVNKWNADLYCILSEKMEGEAFIV